LLVRCANDLERDSSYAEAIRWRFRHIHVDEAQDLTPIQQRLLSALRTPGADDLFIVGDPAQSIYGFNGSDPELLVQIDDRFPGVEVIRLPVNHRCTPQIVSAGVHVLSHAQLPADLRSSQPDGPVPALTAYADEDDEAHGIARSIAEAGQHAIRHGEIAVLARTHQHCTRIERALSAEGVEVRSRGFRGDSSGRRALDEARRISSPSALRSWAHDILDDDADALGGDEFEPTETVSSRQVAAVALEHLREQPDGTGTTFASWMTTADPFEFQQSGGAEVLTFHAAKGREWERVWIAAAETGSVPHRSATTKDETLEEARLLYVAITRATSECHLSWAERRNGYRRSVTPFLAELDLVEPAITGPSAELSDAMSTSAASTSRDALRRLAEWRQMTAVRSGILPEEICSDRMMRRIAEVQPASAERLNEITGWGDLTCTTLFPSLQAALVD
ncbi:MAG: 3'-5' exonuclease, partial [Actinomycetota bacterium]|nr:3'-5' exonuclease [Actinomycetota bacterium]